MNRADRAGPARPETAVTGAVRHAADVDAGHDPLLAGLLVASIGSGQIGYALAGQPLCLVGRALSLAQVDDDGLEALQNHEVRELYTQGRMPVRLTWARWWYLRQRNAVRIVALVRADPNDPICLAKPGGSVG